MGRVHAIDRPVRLVVLDNRLERSRLTVFFRPLLILPHAVWLVLWSVAAVVAAIAQWAVVVVTAAPAASLHGFLARYTRYAAHVAAYGYLAADRYQTRNLVRVDPAAAQPIVSSLQPRLDALRRCRAATIRQRRT